MSQMPPPPAPPAGQMPPGYALRPHRGVMILVFGILAWVVCFIFGVVAWVMGTADMRAMDEGVMDPTGRGLTQAGKIVGMINVILTIIMIPVILILMALGVFAAAAGAGGAGGGP